MFEALQVSHVMQVYRKRRQQPQRATEPQSGYTREGWKREVGRGTRSFQSDVLGGRVEAGDGTQSF